MHRLNPIVLIAVAAVLALLLIIYVFAGGSGDKPERRTERQAQAPRAQDAKDGCDSREINALVKRELFRRAAQLRGTDQAAFDKLAAYSVLRVESPASSGRDDAGTLNCSGTVTIDLPPGVSVVGGRRSLTSEIDYAVQPSADGAGDILTLSNADSLITPLAALVPNGAQDSAPPPPVAEKISSQRAPSTEPAPASERAPAARPRPPRPRAEQAPRTTANTPRRQTPPRPAPRTAARETPPRPAPAPAPAVRETTASPSFNCRNARTGSEIAICKNADLAGLDRQMASQFNSGMSRGTAAQRALLERTRSRFLAYRNRCRTNDCIAGAYSSRMREISDIMAGSWNPN